MFCDEKKLSNRLEFLTKLGETLEKSPEVDESMNSLHEVFFYKVNIRSFFI